METTTKQNAFPLAVTAMVKPWLTGDDEKDAQHFRRCFRMVGMSVEQWRQLIAECRKTNSALMPG